MALTDYQAEVHALAREKGWYDNVDPTTSLWVEKCMANIHGELSEVLDCVAKYGTTIGFPYFYGDPIAGMYGQQDPNPKPEGIGPELADVAIRMLDFLESLGHREAMLPFEGLVKQDLSPLEIAACISRLHRILAACVSFAGDPNPSRCVRFLENVQAFSLALGIDLEEMVRIKHAYNKTRSYRHGGKTI